MGYSPQGCKELDTSEHGTFYSTFYLVTVFDAVHFSRVQLFATSWTAACQASLPFTISWSLLKLTSIESVMRLNNCILCHLLLLLPSIFPGIRVFSNELALCIKWSK